MTNPYSCKSCRSQFQISPQDESFYKKISVPTPEICPDCRSRKRLAYRNERTLYKRKCDLCKKSIISIYAEDKPFPVYCQDCFWGDKWDALDFNAEPDFTRPFFEQFAELMKRVPRLAIVNKQSENSEYCNYSFANKNCYLTFGNHYEEDCLYGHYSTRNRNCIDYLWLYKSELCYECIFSKNCYRSIFLDHCEDCQNCFFSVDLKNCSNCLFCSNLRHKEYHIFNKPYSREEFIKQLNSYGLNVYENFAKAEDFYKGEFRKKFPFRAVYQTNCENCEGDNHENSKNLKGCFDCTACEDCSYGFQMDETYSSMDLNCMGYDRSELCYQTIGCSGIFNCIACDSCWHDNDLAYCNSCFSSKDCFGCISLNKKSNCILNKQYSREEYEKLRLKLIGHMNQTGEWGDFFPISPFDYEESVANEYFPETQKSAKKIQKPDNDALVCVSCDKNYKLIPQELKFYAEMGIPSPRKCPACRHYARIELRNPRHLWDRACSKCGVAIQTAYTPDCPEIVYCEKCYLEMVY
ncbi:hypothetical protein A2344_05795 [Candidatus Peregrinibacteria bacterium RIFOXYB12_FULL_41_12]|nr:MAG: hypothetical protein A2244_04760 [Candidatus Peregrinibacteria bacterium RIFOXYA2_FULL_41_18]OGJ49543.1 MAG: hypothetical protein A2344_05795 [Candidatus Peregrinibacteria bacterium RIFOXYB12_FULL_41_12]OGJ52998.1 MAG: hypothetical protein A2448_04720 [Candidatus Peregrinibacteria bacterium RIFOXYC2_FULL_41_22]OGJ53572.1 MAG: hypothetical protein A2336_00680 [Candidatus Peregrinibacteria bacterium RIFOXYB2_FULL_41_88]